MYKLKILFFLLLFYSKLCEAQVVKCGTEINLAELQRNAPERYARFMALEKHTQDYIKSVKNGNEETLLNNLNSTIIIPIVVHVLDNGNPVGVGGNISDAQIQSQIDVLNEDFRKLNADRINTPSVFQQVAADVNFEFKLACIDPNGNATNGITRTLISSSTFYPQSYKNPDGSYDEFTIGIKYTSQGGKDAWPTNKYLNIWVCHLGPSGFLGYHQQPSDYTAKPNTDGIVVLYNAFGNVGNLLTNYDKGRTATHEIGHWLNLIHTWGDAVCGDDLVADTPEQEKSNNACPSFPHFSNCSNNGTNGDMFMNFMDYTYDACMNLFTEGQKLRMRSVFGAGGPRFPFINEYFNISNVGPNAQICNNTATPITVYNPLCLPVTWSVTGPLTITSGQGTSTVTVTGNNNGLATVTATTSSYTDSKDIHVGVSGKFTLYGHAGHGYENNPPGSAFLVCPSEQLVITPYFINNPGTILGHEWVISGNYSQPSSLSGPVLGITAPPGLNDGFQYSYRYLQNDCGGGWSDWSNGLILTRDCDGGEEENIITVKKKNQNERNNISVAKEPIGNDKSVVRIGRESTFTKVNLFPNPAKDFINIQLPEKFNSALIQVLDTKGTVVLNFKANGSLMKVDIKSLSNGLYLVKIINAQNLTEYVKFIK